jgi:hypothetical protein
VEISLLSIKKKINDIVSKVIDLKISINPLKNKIINEEDIADSYFKNILTQLESCYQLKLANVIEGPVDKDFKDFN